MARGARECASEQLILDPGIGFAKEAAHSLEVLRRLPELAALDRPLLVGPSRKSFIGKVLDLPVGERLMGTAAAVAACVLGGAHVVRVHDVREMVAGRAALRRDRGVGRPGAGGGAAVSALLARLPEFTWIDLIDILIVGFIIYELLQFIRGTHAVQMALGGVVLVVLLLVLAALQPGDRELDPAHLPALRGLRHHRGLPGRDPEGAGPPGQDPAAAASARSARRR